MNIKNILIAICSILFLIIGADKFFAFLEPACTLMAPIPPVLWMGVGVLQIAAAVLIWVPKYRRYVMGFFFVFMLVFTVVHLTQGTNDVGGAVFMAVLLGLLLWNPKFIRGS